MTILDTFFLLFESDASKLDEGLKKTQKKGKETAEELKAVDVVAGKLGHSLGESLKRLGGALLATMAFQSMSASIMAATAHADKLDETSQRLGVSVESLSIWGDVVKRNGGSVESFAGALESFNGQLAQMEATGKSRALPFLKELGIDLEAAKNKGKTALDFLPEIADSLAGMDKQKGAALARRLGLDTATIMTLQGGRREIEAMVARVEELGVVTTKQGEIAAKFNDQQDDTKHALRSLWTEVSTAVLPALTWLSEKFQNVAVWMRKHSDFIVGLMIALGAAITYFVLPPLVSMAAAALVAFAPFLLMGAIVAGVATAFALLYDDVMNFKAGNDSLIGQILEAYPMIATAAQFVADVVGGMGDVFAWVFGTIGDLLRIGFSLWQSYISAVLEFTGIFALVQVLADALGVAFTAMGDLIGGVWDVITGKVRAFLELAKSAVALAKGVGAIITGGLGSAKAALGIAPPAAATPPAQAAATPPATAPTSRATPGSPAQQTQAARAQAQAAPKGPTPPSPWGASPQAVQGAAAGREQLALAAASPIGSVTSNSITNSAQRGGDRTVRIDKVEVQTQATDAKGISQSIGGALGAQLRQASGQFDDGVLA